MHIVVLGAGLIGVTSAWFLAEEGFQVSVVERQPGPALETSFANGGQISASHAMPWANPAAPLNILRWLGREDAPLLWRWRADAAQWAWGLRFLRQCTPTRTRANIVAILALALDSRTRVKALRRRLGLEYDCLERGILHFHTDAVELRRAAAAAALLRGCGCEREMLTAAQCCELEPALAHAATPLLGGAYSVEDESGDAWRFCVELERRCRERGVSFHYNSSVASLRREGRRIVAAQLDDGDSIAADAFVLACGSYSAPLARSLGVRLPLYPVKGYSLTIPVAEGGEAPDVSLIDDACKLVYSRLGDKLRVAGTAEFAGYDVSLSPSRLAAIARRVRQMFPRLRFDEAAAQGWAGLRPSTPGNVPLIGRVADDNPDNLYCNCGHGTLGWTMAVGSGRLLAALVSGGETCIDPRPYTLTG